MPIVPYTDRDRVWKKKKGGSHVCTYVHVISIAVNKKLTYHNSILWYSYVMCYGKYSIRKYGSISYIGMTRKKNDGQQKRYRTDNAKTRM